MSTPLQAPDPRLLERHGGRGPRYTSYPTAPHFGPVDRSALEAAWRAATADLSLYVHVPFCAVRCTFCGCHVKITSRRERSAPYVDRVLAEMDLAGALVDPSRPLRQLHLGGGTPNFLPPEDLRRLVEGLLSRTRRAEGAEQGVELDPRSLSLDQVNALLDLGFNRFSLGVQDLDPAVMEAVNRPQSLHDVREVCEMLRSRGDVPLNFDLIHGLPRQTPESWRRTLDAVIHLRPTRLAVYGYAHVPWLKPHQEALERQGLPSPRERAVLAALAREALVGAGYDEIGMDHYALPDDELAVAARDGTLHRNFMGYTTRRGLDMVALGTSAISRVGRSFTQDVKDLAAWERDVDSGVLPWERGLVLDDDDVLRGEIIMELSCNGRLDLRAFETRHGINFAALFGRELDALRPLEADGLLAVHADRIQLTPVGRYLSRRACMVFDAWLPDDAEADGPRYSTVA